MKKRVYELITKRRVSEQSFYIYQNDVFQLGENRENPFFIKVFKLFIDALLFKNKWKILKKIEIFKLDDWCMIYDTNAMNGTRIKLKVFKLKTTNRV